MKIHEDIEKGDIVLIRKKEYVVTKFEEFNPNSGEYHTVFSDINSDVAQNCLGNTIKTLKTKSKFTLYPNNWKVIRQSILDRDNNACKECGSTLNLEVHHIDTNPENSSKDNLITLCLNCHVKKHLHYREFAIKKMKQ